MYIAYLHTVDQINWEANGGGFSSNCNLHSWHDDYPCCYARDGFDCMWKAFETRLGFSIGDIYEVM